MKQNKIETYYKNKADNINMEDLARLNQLRNNVFVDNIKPDTNFNGIKHFAYSIALVGTLLLSSSLFSNDSLTDSNYNLSNAYALLETEETLSNSYLISDDDFNDIFVSSNDIQMIDILL